MMPYKAMKKQTVIGMPPGIGDLSWIMTKLESFKKENNIEKIKVVMNLQWMTQMNRHTYSIEYLGLIPFIDTAESRIEAIPFEYALDGGSGIPLFKDCGGYDYVIEFNSQLEKGIKLKNILPEYETNYDYPIYEPKEAREFAQALKNKIGGKLVLLFTATKGGNEVWAGDLWTPKDWVALARKIYIKTHCRPVLIGAKWDGDYAKEIYDFDTENIIHSMIGKISIARLFALLREADLLIAFTCGVAIMAVQFRTPVVAFWPIKSKANPKAPFKRTFMRSWLPPWAEEVGYMPIGWGDKQATPDGLFNRIRRYL